MGQHDALRGFLQIGFFIFAAGACTAFLLPRDSGEFIVSICGSLIGLVLILGVLLMWRLMK